MSKSKITLEKAVPVTEDRYMSKITELEKELEKLKEESPKFKIDDELVFKENLLIVRVVEVKRKHKRYIYGVNYRHKHKKGDVLGKFYVEEYDLKYIPINFEDEIFEAYLDYRCKYENLVRELVAPYKENKYYLKRK